jgi:hypothetical protein
VHHEGDLPRGPRIRVHHESPAEKSLFITRPTEPALRSAESRLTVTSSDRTSSYRPFS